MSRKQRPNTKHFYPTVPISVDEELPSVTWSQLRQRKLPHSFRLRRDARPLYLTAVNPISSSFGTLQIEFVICVLRFSSVVVVRNDCIERKPRIGKLFQPLSIWRNFYHLYDWCKDLCIFWVCVCVFPFKNWLFKDSMFYSEFQFQCLFSWSGLKTLGAKDKKNSRTGSPAVLSS